MREQDVPELPVCEGPALPGHASSTSSFGELIAPLAVLGRVRLEALGRVGVPVEVLGREVDTEFERVPVSAPSKEVEEELNSVLARAGERSGRGGGEEGDSTGDLGGIVGEEGGEARVGDVGEASKLGEVGGEMIDAVAPVSVAPEPPELNVAPEAGEGSGDEKETRLGGRAEPAGFANALWRGVCWEGDWRRGGGCVACGISWVVCVDWLACAERSSSGGCASPSRLRRLEYERGRVRCAGRVYGIMVG